jgi:hypothetical protein
MKRKIFLNAGAVLLCLVSSTLIQAADFSEAAFIQELKTYRTSMATLVKKFGPGWAISGMFTSDFVFVTPEGKKIKRSEFLSKDNGFFLPAAPEEIESWREASGVAPQKLAPKYEYWKKPVIQSKEVDGKEIVSLERFPVSLTTQTNKDPLGKEQKHQIKTLFAEKQIFTYMPSPTAEKAKLLTMKYWEIRVQAAFIDGKRLPQDSPPMPPEKQVQ